MKVSACTLGDKIEVSVLGTPEEFSNITYEQLSAISGTILRKMSIIGSRDVRELFSPAVIEVTPVPAEAIKEVQS